MYCTHVSFVFLKYQKFFFYCIICILYDDSSLLSSQKVINNICVFLTERRFQITQFVHKSGFSKLVGRAFFCTKRCYASLGFYHPKQFVIFKGFYFFQLRVFDVTVLVSDRGISIYDYKINPSIAIRQLNPVKQSFREKVCVCFYE